MLYRKAIKGKVLHRIENTKKIWECGVKGVNAIWRTVFKP